MGNHALLSASSSHRWLNCPPSARLCESYDDKGSDFAAEGTDAHALCEYMQASMPMKPRPARRIPGRTFKGLLPIAVPEKSIW